MSRDRMYAGYAMQVGEKACEAGLKFKIKGKVFNGLRFNLLLADYAMRAGGKAGAVKFKIQPTPEALTNSKFRIQN